MCILSVLTVILIKKIVAVVMCDFTFTSYPVFVSLNSIHIVHYFISERIVDYFFLLFVRFLGFNDFKMAKKKYKSTNSHFFMYMLNFKAI